MTNLLYNCVIQDVYYYNPLHVSSNTVRIIRRSNCINPLNVKLNPICHLVALLETHHILHVSGIRFNTASGIVCCVSDLMTWSST